MDKTITLEDIVRLHEALNDNRVILSDNCGELVAGKNGLTIASSILIGAVTGGVGGGIILGGLAIANAAMTRNVNDDPTINDLTTSQSNSYRSRLGFGSVGQQLVEPLQVLPVVHGNRNINPNGGDRVGGYVVNNQITTECGAQIKRTIYVLSVGEIGNISIKDTLLGEQPKEIYFEDEVSIEYRTGTPNQTVLRGFPFYSQAIEPRGFNSLQLNKVGVVDQVEVVNSDPLSDNVEVLGGVVTPLIEGYGNSGYFGSTPVNPAFGGRATFSVDGASESGVGLSAVDGDLTQQTIEFGFEFFGGTFAVIESSTLQTTPAPYNQSDQFEVVVEPGGAVKYFKNNILIFTSASQASAPLFLDIGFNNLGAVTASVNGIGAESTPTQIYSIKLEENIDGEGDAEKNQDFYGIEPQIYMAVCKDGGEPQGTPTNPADPIVNNGFGFMRVQTKDFDNKTLIVKEVPDLHGLTLNLESGDELFEWNYIRYETTKRVDTLYLNFIWDLSASKVEDSSPYPHGIVYDIFIRRTDETDLNRLGRFFTQGIIKRQIFTMLKIENLALGRYYLEIRPVFCEVLDSEIPVIEMNSSCINRQFTSSFDSGNGIVTLTTESSEEIELDDDVGFNNTIGFDREKKNNISSENGSVGVLKFVDEIVKPESLGKDFASVNYPNLALAAITYRVDTQSNTVSFLVNEGVKIPNYTNWGTASPASDQFNLVDVNNQWGFDDETSKIGWTIQNVRNQQTASITGFTQFGISHDEPIDWRECDEYVVYFINSSPYFPDVFAWFLTNQLWGVGRYYGEYANRFVDWESIVTTRRFCKSRGYFYDRAIENDINIDDWSEKEANNSYLYPCIFGARRGLKIHEFSDIKMVFTAANINNYQVESPNLADFKFNRLVVVYRDGRDSFDHDGRGRSRPEVIIIETPDVFAGNSKIIEQRISLTSVTNQYQAVDIGKLYFKLNSQQQTLISFETSYLGLDLRAGDIIAVKYKVLERKEDFSGFITSITELDDKTCIELDNCEIGNNFNNIDNFSSSFYLYNREFDAPKTLDNVSIAPISVDGVTKWLVDVPFGTLKVHDVAIIGVSSDSDRYFRCISCTPKIDSNVTIRAINVSKEFFSGEDLVVRVDDSDIPLNQ